MAAEVLAALVPSAKGDAKTIALRKVDVMKEKVLGPEPALLVQLNRAAGSVLNIKAAKVGVGTAVTYVGVFVLAMYACTSILRGGWRTRPRLQHVYLAICRQDVFVFLRRVFLCFLAFHHRKD